MTTRTEPLPIPGTLWGYYPQRRQEDGNTAIRRLEALAARLASIRRSAAMPHARFVQEVARRVEGWGIGREPPLERLPELRATLARDGLSGAALTECFAILSLVSERTLGLRPHENQLAAARVMLNRGLAEMATGEGKTLAVAIAAACAAMAGIPVHVITANDYLAVRDSRRLKPLYASLGLTVGVVTGDMSLQQRRSAYACDITYCSPKEVGFDYLRDLQSHPDRRRHPLYTHLAGIQTDGRPHLLRGLCMAIVDEADSVLLDEARVPLILAQQSAQDKETVDHAHALALASTLTPTTDFVLDAESRQARLTSRGRERLGSAASALAGGWGNRIFRENRVELALVALHLMRRDRDYILHKGAIGIVDPNTGRVAEGRAWSMGLHQLVELKEGCTPSSGQQPIAQITVQQLFRRYLWLAGVSGTLTEARAELAEIYRLAVTRIPTQHPVRRQSLGRRLFPDRDRLLHSAVTRTQELNASGRPVLIGTDSVADSEALAERLRTVGIVPQVLNARHDRDEARIVSLAGQRGQVTVATNMAGRGTDIPLGSGVADLGGLHVISCQHNGERRIDRQLAGRCARHGEPGSFEHYMSLDAELWRRRVPAWLSVVLARGLESSLRPVAETLGLLVFELARRVEERALRAERRRLLRDHRTLARLLAFTGRAE